MPATHLSYANGVQIWSTIWDSDHVFAVAVLPCIALCGARQLSNNFLLILKGSFPQGHSLRLRARIVAVANLRFRKGILGCCPCPGGPEATAPRSPPQCPGTFARWTSLHIYGLQYLETWASTDGSSLYSCCVCLACFHMVDQHRTLAVRN